MKRRGFLSLVGGAVTAGPSVAKQSLQDLSFGPNVGQIGQGILGVDQMDCAAKESGYSSAQIAKDTIAKLTGKSEEQKKSEKMRQCISHLDPSIASLRSVNMQTRIKMSRDMEWERHNNNEIDYWRGIMKGWN